MTTILAYKNCHKRFCIIDETVVNQPGLLVYQMQNICIYIPHTYAEFSSNWHVVYLSLERCVGNIKFLNLERNIFGQLQAVNNEDILIPVKSLINNKILGYRNRTRAILNKHKVYCSRAFNITEHQNHCRLGQKTYQ